MATTAGLPVVVAALTYAGDYGWRVFPLAGKVPRTRHGLKDATTDTGQIAEWWRRWPDAGVAIRTGSVSGLVVLDCDGKVGADTLAELEHRRGELPGTVRCVTGGGGEHYYFRHPGGEVRNSAGALGPGLDTRADGGFIVAPPSPHPSGRRYEWDLPPDEVELAEPPGWLLSATRRRVIARPVSEWRQLASDGASEGERNERTAQLAGHLLSRNVDPFVVLELLVAWDAKRNRPPLRREEVTRTVASIARREAEKWRT